MKTINYKDYYQKSIDNPIEFWDKEAENISWFSKYKQVLDDSNKPIYRWFVGGKINVCYNLVDRHIEQGRGDQVAIYYHSEMDNKKIQYTYQQLKEEVCNLAATLTEMGVVAKDRVIIYMPMIPEAIFAILACTRIGAIHSVVFGGFSSKVLSERIDDCKPKVILSASCGLEPNKIINYKDILDESINRSQHQIKSTLILQREKLKCKLKENFDFDWSQKVLKNQSVECVPMNSEDFLYILYTSGTTGNPKGIVRDCGSYLVALYWSMKYLYDMNPGETYWAASDIGWVVGHSYIVYAPLLYGCATVLYEGKPVGTPDAGVFWKIIEAYKVKVLFTAPTAIRAIIREDSKGEFIKQYNISSLKSLFLAGERTDPATMRWAEEKLKVPVVDHWWQTETGWAICGNPLGFNRIHNQPMLKVKEGSCSIPMPGWNLQILGEDHKPVGEKQMGMITIKLPIPPSSMVTIWGKDDKDYKNDKFFIKKYLAEFPGFYQTGDAGVLDEDGYLTVLSRTDDIINVAGHRISTGEVEEVIANYNAVAECAVVGVRDNLKGEVPVGFVVLKKDSTTLSEDKIISEIINKIRKEIGSVVALRKIFIVTKLPKTRSGKILRATIRKIIHQEEFSMPPTIEDPYSLELIKEVTKNEKS